jgi:hypothetical protein
MRLWPCHLDSLHAVDVLQSYPTLGGLESRDDTLPAAAAGQRHRWFLVATGSSFASPSGRGQTAPGRAWLVGGEA